MTGNPAPAGSFAPAGPRSLGVSVRRCPSVPRVFWSAPEQTAGEENPSRPPRARPCSPPRQARREAQGRGPQGDEAHR